MKFEQAGCRARISITSSPFSGAALPMNFLMPPSCCRGAKRDVWLNGLKAIAGEGARRFAHIVFAIVTDPDGEELHQLARPVLVRMRWLVLRQIEVDHHRRIARDRFCQANEVAERVVP